MINMYYVLFPGTSYSAHKREPGTVGRVSTCIVNKMETGSVEISLYYIVIIVIIHLLFYLFTARHRLPKHPITERDQFFASNHCQPHD